MAHPIIYILQDDIVKEILRAESRFVVKISFGLDSDKEKDIHLLHTNAVRLAKLQSGTCRVEYAGLDNHPARMYKHPFGWIFYHITLKAGARPLPEKILSKIAFHAMIVPRDTIGKKRPHPLEYLAEDTTLLAEDSVGGNRWQITIPLAESASNLVQADGSFLACVLKALQELDAESLDAERKSIKHLDDWKQALRGQPNYPEQYADMVYWFLIRSIFGYKHYLIRGVLHQILDEWGIMRDHNDMDSLRRKYPPGNCVYTYSWIMMNFEKIRRAKQSTPMFEAA